MQRVIHVFIKNSMISPALLTLAPFYLFNKANVFGVPSNPYADTCTKKKGRGPKLRNPLIMDTFSLFIPE